MQRRAPTCRHRTQDQGKEWRFAHKLPFPDKLSETPRKWTLCQTSYDIRPTFPCQKEGTFALFPRTSSPDTGLLEKYALRRWIQIQFTDWFSSRHDMENEEPAIIQGTLWNGTGLVVVVQWWWQASCLMHVQTCISFMEVKLMARGTEMMYWDLMRGFLEV